MTPDDRELARLFEAERRADESAAPELSALLDRAGPRLTRPAGGRRRTALAITIACLLAAAALLKRGEAGRRVTPEEAVPIAEWRSPTAFLLETPGSELLSEIPTFTLRPDAGNIAPLPTKGVAR